MHDVASELCNELLETYFDEYYYSLYGNRKRWMANINLKNYLLKDMIIVWSKLKNKK